MVRNVVLHCIVLFVSKCVYIHSQIYTHVYIYIDR